MLLLVVAMSYGVESAELTVNRAALVVVCNKAEGGPDPWESIRPFSARDSPPSSLQTATVRCWSSSSMIQWARVPAG